MGGRKFERGKKKKEIFFILEFLQKTFIELYDDFVNKFAWSLQIRTKWKICVDLVWNSFVSLEWHCIMFTSYACVHMNIWLCSLQEKEWPTCLAGFQDQRITSSIINKPLFWLKIRLLFIFLTSITLCRIHVSVNVGLNSVVFLAATSPSMSLSSHVRMFSLSGKFHWVNALN